MGAICFYKYLLMKHKKLNISATVHITRKIIIYSGRYLKGCHLENKIGWGEGVIHSKMLKGGVSKTNYVKLELQTPKFHKALYRPWE